MFVISNHCVSSIFLPAQTSAGPDQALDKSLQMKPLPSGDLY